MSMPASWRVTRTYRDVWLVDDKDSIPHPLQVDPAKVFLEVSDYAQLLHFIDLEVQA